jgi:hypothetical protein
MIKKFILVALMLLLTPALACAGLIAAYVASGGSTGSISPPGSIYASSAKTLTLTADSGYTLNFITNNGVPVPSSQISGSGPWTYVVPLSSSVQTIYVYFKLAPVIPPTQLVASAPANVSVVLNTPQVISGQTSTISYLQPGTMAKFKWTSNPAAGAVFSPISSSVTTPANVYTSFTATATGPFTATLTLTAPGATPSATNVSISVESPGAASSNYCLGCHSGGPEAVSYLGSPHASSANGPSCQSCHNPGLALPHPGYSLTDMTANPGLYYSCVTCHYPGSTIVSSWPPAGFAFHTAYNFTNACTQCHDPHTTLFNNNLPYPHFADSTTSAQFVNPNITCNNCHVSAVDNSFNIYSANYQWALSGKGNPTSPAYVADQFQALGTSGASPATSTANDCVRCHTTTGYINYVTSNFTNIAPFGPAAGSREMIACSACHNPTPFDATFDRRTVGIHTGGPPSNIQPYAFYGYSSGAYGKEILTNVYSSQGQSNLCIVCHTGRVSGQNIQDIATKVGPAGAFWSNVGFICSHYMASAALLFENAAVWPIGYEYRAGTSNPIGNFAHPAIGDATLGPCISCHMNGSVKKHLFTPVSTATNGTITAITSTTCFAANCHASGNFTASFLQAQKTGYQAALAVVAAQLAARGIYYNAGIAPYFFSDQAFTIPTTNWILTINGTRFGSNVMGAAFNLMLLQSDGGAYTHNDWYTKRLLYDTLDFLDDGVENDSILTTLQNMCTTPNNLSCVDATTLSNAESYLFPRP